MEVKVLARVNHNGKDYGHGDIIKRIKEEDAKRLIDLEVAEELDTTSSEAEEIGEISEEVAKKNE